MEIMTLIITGLLILLGFAPFFGKIFKFVRFKNMIDKLPGPKSYPLIGTLYLVAGKPRDQIIHIFSAMRKDYPGGIYRMWYGLMPEVKVSNNNAKKKTARASIEFYLHTYKKII